jgi:hypothetical protein
VSDVLVHPVLVHLTAGPVGTAVTVLAQDPAPPPGEGPEFGEASPIALVVILALGLAVVFLVVSMTRRIRRLPESFGPPDEESGEDAVRDEAAADATEPASQSSSPSEPGTGPERDSEDAGGTRA